MRNIYWMNVEAGEELRNNSVCVLLNNSLVYNTDSLEDLQKYLLVFVSRPERNTGNNEIIEEGEFVRACKIGQFI